MLKNDLAGQWVRILRSDRRVGSGQMAQVLNHPTDDGKYFVSGVGFSWRFQRDEFEIVERPDPLPTWGYPEWHPLAGDDEAMKPEPVYGPNWSHDPSVDAWYFTLSEGEVCRTEGLTGYRTVNIDYGHGGSIVGVEVL